jgi:hypothetical protein
VHRPLVELDGDDAEFQRLRHTKEPGTAKP